MSTFNFRPVHILDIQAADEPRIKIENNVLTLTASRDGEQLVITTPLPASSELLKLGVISPQNGVVRVEATKTPRSAKPSRTMRRRWAGGHAIGENHHLAKLKEQDIREIRAMSNDKNYCSTFNSVYAMYVDLAKTYNIHYTTVHKIVKNQTWKHVTNV